jgi:pimeloyl-ACP methyl ester carboxylesterase
VIAVGHSMGGLVITQAAAEPRLFAGLLYRCAFAPQRDESLLLLGGSDATSRVTARGALGARSQFVSIAQAFTGSAS